MGDLEKFIHRDDLIHPLIKVACVHAQFETIHPFLDGNGRLGRLIITYLLCSWKVLDKPLLYISYFFKAHRTEYYARLMEIRLRGDWESWIKFFLRAVKESSELATHTATDIHKLITSDREAVKKKPSSSITEQAFDQFCRQPILTNANLVDCLKTTKPTIQKALDNLISHGVISEISGKKRGRSYAYKAYLDILTKDTITQIG